MDSSSNNTPQLNDGSYLPAPPLNEDLESCLYTSYETIVGLNLLAQATAETERDYHGQTENTVLVNATSIKKSQSTNTMDGDNLTDYPSISPVLGGMEVVQKSSGFFSKFDWFRCEWRPLNKRKTTHSLGLKGAAGLVRLWFISTTEYTSLTIDKFDGLTIKIRLFKEDYTELKKRLIQHCILLFVWDPNQLLDKIDVFTKREYLHAQIQTLFESDDNFLMTRMLDNRYFPFTYNGNEIGMDEEEFFEPGWTVNDFSRDKVVAVEAQIHLRNFKTRSQPHGACDHSICPQSVYAFPSTPIPNASKRQIKSNPTLYPPYTKKSKIV